MGVSGFSDNESALDVGDFSVARHRETPATFNTGIIVSSEEHLNMYTTGLLTSTNNFNSGATFELKSQSQVRLAPGHNAFSGSSGRVYIVDPCTASYSKLADEGSDEPDMGPDNLTTSVDNVFAVVAYPNPFTSSTTLQYTLPKASAVRIAMYDIRGQEVQLLLQSSEQMEGQHSMVISGANLAAGTYFVQILAGENVGRTKLVVTN